MEDVDLSGESGGPFPSQRWPRPQPLQQGESPSAGSPSPSAWTSISVDTPNLSSFRKRLFGDNDGGGDGGTSVVDEDDLLTDLCPQPPVAGIMAPLSELNASAGFGGRSSVPGSFEKGVQEAVRKTRRTGAFFKPASITNASCSVVSLTSG